MISIDSVNQLEIKHKDIDEVMLSHEKKEFWRNSRRTVEKIQSDGEGSLIDSLCSQTAHDRNVLGRCAQWKTDSGHSHEGDKHECGRSFII